MKNYKEAPQKKPIHILTQESLANHLPGKIPVRISSGGDSCCNYWEPSTNYIIAGQSDANSAALAITLAEQFAADGGHVIWIGVAADLPRLCEQLMFRIAGIEPKAAGTQIVIDDAAQVALLLAHEKISKMWIDFCNVEDCGDADIEQEFLASVASFKPTLIVVDESIFDETTLDPFEALVRQTLALHMVNELRGMNPMSSVLWHLPMRVAVDDGVSKQRPTLDDLTSAASSIKPDVVMLVHACDELKSQHNAEVIVAANAFGSTGIVPMAFDPIHCTWHDLANSARAD